MKSAGRQAFAAPFPGCQGRRRQDVEASTAPPTAARSSRCRTKGGLDRVVTQVGACPRTDCSYNQELECSAAAVKIGAGTGDHAANCLTYTPAT